jgi:hypothetical protein
MSFHEKHPKKAVEALVHGIRPLALKQLVKNQLDLDHKLLRNCVLSFFDFVKDKMRPRLELARAGAPVRLVKEEPKRSANPSTGLGNGTPATVETVGPSGGGTKDPQGRKPWTKASGDDAAPRKLSC